MELGGADDSGLFAAGPRPKRAQFRDLARPAAAGEKSRFRSSLAGCTVTIHEHLDGTVSIRYGPHVVGRYTATG